MTDNTCIMCGDIVPEGRIVCPACQTDIERRPDDCEECKLRQEPTSDKWPNRGKRKRARGGGHR